MTEQLTINNELKQIALSVRELNNCIKSMNIPNSTVATIYNELQEIFGKLVNAMKYANEQKDGFLSLCHQNLMFM